MVSQLMAASEQTGTIQSSDEISRRDRFSGWKFWLIALLAHAAFFAICAQFYILVIKPQGAMRGQTYDSGPIAVAPPMVEPEQPIADQQVVAQPQADMDKLHPIITAMDSPIQMPSSALAPPSFVKGLPGPKAMFAPTGVWGKRGRPGDFAPKEVEESVLKALRWLKANQNEDGSWGKQYPVAMTGLALLTFLAHGETLASRDFGTTVKRGLDFLLSKGEQGRLGGRVDYEHGIATYALAEAYGLTKDPRIRETLEKCVETIINGQADPGGGWIYNFSTKDNFGDMSISGWQVQALKAAYLAGVMPDKIEKCLDKAMEYSKKVYNPQSRGFGYRNGTSSLRSMPSRDNKSQVWSLTGTGALCLQFWGQARSPEAEGALQHMRENLVFDPMKDRGAHGDLYGYYYATQALFLGDGPHGKGWTAWDQQYRKPLIATQNPDGSFPEYGTGAAEDKFVFGTTLSALMLEVWYRNDPAALTVLKTQQR